ncbi:MAG: DUF2877 domain-containing protein [Acetivibrionales bacterium]|jgi:hypothetical protein
MSEIIESRITREFAAIKNLAGFIHSRSSKGCNLKFILPCGSTRIITVLPARFAVLPDTLAVDVSYYEIISMLPTGSRVLKNNLTISFEQIKESLTGSLNGLKSNSLIIDKKWDENEEENEQNFISFIETFKRYHRSAKKIDGFAQLPVKTLVELKGNLYNFCNAFLEGDTEKLSVLLVRCAGIGRGLTPSSDDALIGIIAVLTGAILVRHPSASDVLCDFIDNVKHSYKDVFPYEYAISNYSTEIGKKYLCCAAEGRFSDMLLDLVSDLYGGKPCNWENDIDRVAQIGSTSGMDTLIGVSIGCKYLLNNHHFSAKN